MRITPKFIARIALLSAISIILGKFLSFKIGDNFRISFENLTIILSGYLYGPVIGLVCGTVADIVGCLCYGYAINPIITVGAAMIGAYAGIFGKKGCTKKASLALSVAAAHITGSMLIKSLGLHLFYSTHFGVLIWRIPIYIVTGILEYILIRICLNHRGLRNLMEN